MGSLNQTQFNELHEIEFEMLISASESLKSRVRESDMLARLGGDEFLLVLPNRSKENAEIVMEHSLKYFEKEGIKHVQKRYLSYGCAMLLASLLY